MQHVLVVVLIDFVSQQHQCNAVAPNYCHNVFFTIDHSWLAVQQSDHSFPLVILFGLILLNEVSLITPPYCVVILVNGQCEFVFVCSSPVLFSPSPYVH